MPWGDVRGLLQYVPRFSGKVFVIVIDAPVPALAETMLDLVTLQNIGVQLVIGSTVHSKDDLLDRAAEVELKYNQSLLNTESGPDEALAALGRGQAVVLDVSAGDPLSANLATFAQSVSAEKLILLRGVGEDLPRGAMRAVEVASAPDQIMRSAAAACQVGIPRVHVLDGETPGVLLSELFSNEGVGTMVYADSYRVIRPLREDDIVELLGMIGRSVRNAHLVPRDYADIEKNLTDYSMMEIDGNVVGSVALLRYPDSDSAEVGCLYIKQSHEGLGYGVELVKHAEQRAHELGLSSVFALTNRAAEFFQSRLGYEEWAPDRIPAQRHQQLLTSNRDSRVFGKTLS
ncbi:MAG: GNAT family N-acetyltransferase [Verrucomicrobiae bacterium]|nr:GNAT family N-acetyltransferase [Verrucomicrobiae bacterium]NNJ43277.1 GNAT family N-acetyltransferase [Akkermansiaceae bacterium]